MLRFGCFGCLTVLCSFAAVGLIGWGTFQVTRVPELSSTPISQADGLRAQQKIFDVVRHAGGGRPRTVTLSEQELNAFLTRHLADTGDLPLRQLTVRLSSDDRAEIAGHVPLRQVLSEPPFSALRGVLPTAWLERPMWLSLRARVTLETRDGGRARRQLRLDVERFWLGRLRLPEVMLRILLDPTALRLLRSPMPDAIDGLRVEPGRLVIRGAS